MVPYLCELLAASQRNRPKCEKMKDVSSSRLALYVSSVRRRLNAHALHVRVSTISSLRIPSSSSSAKGKRERERRAHESVHRRRLCNQESARLQRPPRKGRPAKRRVRNRAISFLGLNQVRRVAGESDEDREVRLQVLRTKDPGSVPLELVVSVLVTVVSFTLTCFSSHLIVTGTDPGRVIPIMSVYRQYSGHVVNLPQDVASFVQSLPTPPSL